jgi:hypothetical protein
LGDTRECFLLFILSRQPLHILCWWLQFMLNTKLAVVSLGWATPQKHWQQAQELAQSVTGAWQPWLWYFCPLLY